MGRATSKGNEAKSKMKHSSDMLTQEIRTRVVVIQQDIGRPRRRPLGHRTENMQYIITIVLEIGFLIFIRQTTLYVLMCGAVLLFHNVYNVFAY